MSARRQAGDRVRLRAGAGMCGEADRLVATIQPEPDGAWWPCIGHDDCGDPECREWLTLWTDPDPEAGGRRHMLCHVSECEMEDAGPGAIVP